ncbi:DNA polymerase III subunit tau [BD1-7 clade bacterium]|uniref:DNA polymerase III subunit gamma/tau n=1 Tax=BD1-7 clade bacterium TaxID=2029982 RepID=A0A5S9NS84_9GAMM|nr:DNA polymerase III subunit tau [BD1-7 clade bacterium]CAA0093271.1 DNA polymerase III subunit tau [BD1-7 clade bacterium]
MSYQVLARKWRPRFFREMVGQEHVLQALINALDNGRLHHAYLFTGTRGVGKTTIARILAKCLNCEVGVTSEPCGQCGACQEIAEGRFVDLIEVDAASRTKVEDTRELLENVQYAPTKGRFKVYLIDEVHMLSTHSFNALLKTLEEPPEHVKFLLATTDPQKLPATILSRCLQFNLKNMMPEPIVGHLSNVLTQESVTYEEPALWALARAAHGSMRDALSLTDQAIAYGFGTVGYESVRNMLGSIDQQTVMHLAQALVEHDAARLLKEVETFSELSPDYAAAMDELLMVLHRMTIAQTVPDALDNSQGDKAQVESLAQQVAAEELQLFYQMGLLGKRDLPLAPDLRTGFEMALLRMLTFRPKGIKEPPVKLAIVESKTSEAIDPSVPAVEESSAPSSPVSENVPVKKPEPSASVEVSPGAITAANTAYDLSGASEPKAPVDEVVEPAASTVVGAAAREIGESEAVVSTFEDVDAEVVHSAPEIAGPEIALEASAGVDVGSASPLVEHSADEVIVVGDHDSALHRETQTIGELRDKVSSNEVVVDTSIDADPADGSNEGGVGVAEGSAVANAAELVEVEPNVAVKRLLPESNTEWVGQFTEIGFTGLLRSIALECVLDTVSDNQIRFTLDQDKAQLYNARHPEQIADAIGRYCGQQVSVIIELAQSQAITPSMHLENLRRESHQRALDNLHADTGFKDIIESFEGQLDVASVAEISTELT